MYSANEVFLEDIYLVTNLWEIMASNDLKLYLNGCFFLVLYLLRIMTGCEIFHFIYYDIVRLISIYFNNQIIEGY